MICEVKSLSKTYGQGQIEVKALDRLSLTIEKGEFTAIVGPSGSGKSTLLHLMGGLDKPSAGEVFLSGNSLFSMKPGELSNFRRDHIGFIFQSYNLIPVLSAAENVEYILLLQNRPAQERTKMVKAALASVGLEGLENRRPNQLSGGQQQRVAVARAIASHPNLILADEPTANLDSKTGWELIEMMRRLNEKSGVTFVFSTHDPKIIESAKRLVYIRDGKIEKDTNRLNEVRP